MEAKEQINREYKADLAFNPFGITEEHYIGAFMKLLDQKIHEAKDMLIERFNWIVLKILLLLNLCMKMV